jgi:acyl dehydratase
VGSEERSANPSRTTRGLCFEEFSIGDVHRSKARTLTEADIAAFAGLSGDFNPLHTDEEYARSTPFRGRIAHGMLVQSIATGLANQTLVFDGTTAAVMEMILRFRAPARAGDTLSIALTVREKEPKPGPKRGWVRFATSITNQRAEVVCEGEWLLLMHRSRQRAAPEGEAAER